MYTVIGNRKLRTFRVLWALEEMGLDYTLREAAPRSDEIRALNPSGKVPALIEDGNVILDSVAINQYLADKHGMLTFPAGTLERARQDSFTHFACDEMDAVLWTAARHSFVLPKERRVAPITPVLKWEFGRSMQVLGERLGTQEYLMGTVFTVADILTAHCGRWARNAGFTFDAPNVDAYFDRVLDRPACKRALAPKD